MCKNGLIISEYPRKLEVKKDQIAQRLRLVSGISDKNVKITDGKELKGDEAFPVFVAKGQVV